MWALISLISLPTLVRLTELRARNIIQISILGPGRQRQLQTPPPWHTCCAEARKLGRKSQSISRCEGWCHSHDRVRMEKMNDAIDSTDNHEIRINTGLISSSHILEFMISIDIDDGKAWVDQSTNPRSSLGVDDDPKSISNPDGAVGSDRNVSTCVEENKDYFLGGNWMDLILHLTCDSIKYRNTSLKQQYASWNQKKIQYLMYGLLVHLQGADKV